MQPAGGLQGDSGGGDNGGGGGRVVAGAVPDCREIGRGLARYDAADATRIAGVKSANIEATLGFTAGATLIHADDLALAR